MDLSPLLSAARDQLSRGDTGQAIQILLTTLEHNTLKASALDRTLRVVEANYQAVRQKELKGILSFSEAQKEYNRINDALLAMVDDLAAGRTPAVESPEKKAPALRWWLVGGALAVLVLVAGVVAGRRLGRKPKEAAIVATAKECPSFDANRLRVLVLPFQSLDEQKVRPELALQSRIRELSNRNQFPVDIEVYAGELPENNAPDIRAASDFGRRCQADLVVWGLYEKKPETIEIDISYAFLDGMQQSGATGFKRFSGLSALQNGRVQKDFDDAVFSLCAVMALRRNNPELAAKWLDKVKNKGQADEAMIRAMRQ